MSSEISNSNRDSTDTAPDPQEPLADDAAAPVSASQSPSEKGQTDETENDEVSAVFTMTVQRYKGDQCGKLFHGEGVVLFHGGNVYKGTFVNGLMKGHGEYTWVNGLKYEGNFESNVPMGHGTYTWPDGSYYEGEIRYGIRHGTGTYKCSQTSTVYKGQWNQGKRHGKGTVFYNEERTSWYEGDWQNNNKEGWGVWRYPSGNIYEGQWKKNIRHGQGKMKWVQLGQQYSGQWINGIQHGRGTHTWFLRRVPDSQYPLTNEYRGAFVYGLRHGQGTFSYSSGAIYSGGWKQNKKHGKGVFILKNGHIIEGEFVDDQIAEFPELCINGTTSSEIKGIKTCFPSPGSFTTIAQKSGGRASLLGPDLSLNIQTLLHQIPEQQREQELKQVECVIMRHISLLRALYNLYSGLGHERSPDNTFLLTRLQFWRFLKDCEVVNHGITLGQMDCHFADRNIFDTRLQEVFSPEEVHSPFTTFLLRQCLSCLVIAAYHIYHSEVVSSSNVLAECLSKLMKQNIIPNAKNIKGPAFCHPHRAVISMQYINKCWDIYQAFSKANSAASSGQTITARQFIWMLKDFGLFDSNLSTARVLEFLSVGDSAAYSATRCSLDLEISFLEFFEALVGCAEVTMQEESIEYEHPQTDLGDQDQTSMTLLTEELKDIYLNGQQASIEVFKAKAMPQPSSTEEVEQSPTEAGTVLGLDIDLEIWTHRIHQFFTKVFFPAYSHTLLADEKLKEERLKLLEMNRIALEKAVESARRRGRGSRRSRIKGDSWKMTADSSST